MRDLSVVLIAGLCAGLSACDGAAPSAQPGPAVTAVVATERPAGKPAAPVAAPSTPAAAEGRHPTDSAVPATGICHGQVTYPVTAWSPRTSMTHRRDAELLAHVKAVGAAEGRSVEELATALTAPARTEREKAWVLFAWVASNIAYDDAGYRAFLAGNAPPAQPADRVLESRRAVCQGYAGLFDALATSAGLRSVVVEGWALGFGYGSGGDLGPPNHAWNAVFIDGDWQLLDTTWGAGALKDGFIFHRHFNPFFFLTPPEHLAATHRPRESSWQLLDAAVPAEVFTAGPRIWPAAYDFGVAPLSHRERQILFLSGAEAISLAASPGVALKGHLYRDDGTLVEGDWVLPEPAGEGGTLRVRPPAPGLYRLSVFAGDRRSTAFEPVLDYEIRVPPTTALLGPFPRQFETWVRSGAVLTGVRDARLAAGPGKTLRIENLRAAEVTLQTAERWYPFTPVDGGFELPVPQAAGPMRLSVRACDQPDFSSYLLFEGATAVGTRPGPSSSASSTPG